VACETVRLALPGLLTVIVWVLVVPTVTLPKLALAGTTEICCDEAATPVALREMVVSELGALLTKVRLPVALLAAVGAKLTVNAVD